MQRMMRWVGLGLALGLGAAGCSARQRIKAETTAASLLISDEQEEQLGQQVKAELEQKQNIRYVQDPAVLQYVNDVSTRILRQANRDRKGVKWKIHVIDDPKTVNAFATPGGYLYVYTGLILAADNEAELAGVMGHEAGHVVARHSARQMVSAYGLQAVAAMALGKNPGQVAQVAASLAGSGALLANGRSQELEADELGAKYTAGVNYDPHGIATFFEKLQRQEGKTPRVLTWLSTHPPSGERVQKINAFIQANNLQGTETGADRLAAIKQKLGGG